MAARVSSLAGAQGLTADDEYDLPAPMLAETSQSGRRRNLSPTGMGDGVRLEAELRCLLASLRHADRELRTARSSIAAGPSAQPERLRRSRSLDREELQVCTDASPHATGYVRYLTRVVCSRQLL